MKPIHSSCFPVSSHWPILLESLQSSGQVSIKALNIYGLQQLSGLSIKHLNQKWNTLKIIENNLIIDNSVTQYNEIWKCLRDEIKFAKICPVIKSSLLSAMKRRNINWLQWQLAFRIFMKKADSFHRCIKVLLTPFWESHVTNSSSE